MSHSLAQFLKEQINNKELTTFITKNKISAKSFNQHYKLFMNYVNSYELCKRENINKCQQEIPGYRRKLVMSNGQITTVLTDCLHRINKLDQKEAMDKFLIRHYPDSMLSLSWTKDFIVVGNERLQIATHLKEILNEQTQTGLFLYGDPGIGKTFIFILIANKLIQMKNTVSFISWPQFISDIKANFDKSANNVQLIEQVKSSDYLFIDDLGGESITAWERDELLFPILNARSLALKTTFINSSYTLNALAECYRVRQSPLDEVKIKRLIDRIKRLTIPINLKKENLGE